MKNIISNFPFLGMIVINVMAQGTKFSLENAQTYATLITIFLLVNFGIALLLKIKSYFLYGVTGIAVLGSLAIFVVPSLGQLYLENVIPAMYLGLLLATVVPPLLGFEPFTVEFSKKDYPATITEGSQFKRINLIINYIWTALFAIAIATSLLTYNNDEGIDLILKVLVPIAILLSIGLPATLILPNYLMQKVPGTQLHFKSIEDLFSSMPFGFNKEKAKGVNALVQFYLSGEEPTEGYFIIENQKCSYNQGVHPAPKTIIRSDSALWLQISNNETSGEKAMLNGLFTMEGDATIMLKFADLFTASQPEKKKKVTPKKASTFKYGVLEPQKVKNIVVFDGGPRTDNFSKTTFMVNHFIDGAKQAGANVEYIKLDKYKIHHCIGCYNCWTKNPGVCTFNNDMTELKNKYRDADLVVFASPLYIFSVTGIMKNFMDRLLPLMKPYMITNESGSIMHPDRYPEKGKQGIAVFSASGFPEVEHNFDGLISTYRSWSSHSQNAELVGEFFLPAAELLTQPVYAERKNMVKDLCIKAGKDIVEKGKIDQDLMLTIQDPQVAKETFQQQANLFWESLDGKKAYLTDVPKLTEN